MSAPGEGGEAPEQALGLDRGAVAAAGAPTLHLYQDLAPVNSLVVSTLDPAAYYDVITATPQKFIKFPGMCFVELELGALAADPENGQVGDLPYSFMHHLREALMTLGPGSKETKLVHRVHSLEFPYRMVKGGFYVGNGKEFAYYPMPTAAEMRRDHATWWRTANLWPSERRPWALAGLLRALAPTRLANDKGSDCAIRRPGACGSSGRVTFRFDLRSI